MSDNREILINHLESLSIFDSRYEKLKCINYNSILKEKIKGHFSLVFQGYDQIEEKYVAIKFYDPHPDVSFIQYRTDAFKREPILLSKLVGKNRCLQLISGIKPYNIEFEIPNSNYKVTIPCHYFITDWIDKEIDEYFINQINYDPIIKLRLFNEIILAVEALHRNSIFHRDIKPDNFRAYEENLKRIVILIDLGTAARYDSFPMIGDYGSPVGALLYSSPESFCGLAGHRSIAFYSDYYALGCMLFELFCKSLLGYEIKKSGYFDHICAAICQLMITAKNTDDKLVIWKKEIKRFKNAIIIPGISSQDHTAPKSIIDLLDAIIVKMCCFDYNDRVSNLEEIRRKTNNCIRILENHKYEQKQLEKKKEIRRLRALKVMEKEKRINEFMLKHNAQMRIK